MRHRWHAGIVAALGMAVVVACGGGDGGGGGVTNPPGTTLGSITVSPSPVVLGAGQVQALTPTALDDKGAAISGATGYSYTSSAPTVAQVSNRGQVVGLTAGSATITVSLTLNGVTKTATVTATVGGSLPNAITIAAGALTNDFTPDLAAIARGGSVSWTFGATAHNVEFGGTSGAPSNIGNSSNTTVARTFAAAGSFAYTCTLHSGQNGTVIVP